MPPFDMNPYGSIYGQQLQDAAREAMEARGGNMFWKGLKRIGKGIAGITEESQSAKDQRANLNAQGAASSGFADYLQGGVRGLSEESAALRAALAEQAAGRGPSLAAEQLRQGLQQNVAAQRSMAASASPGNAAMAARQAAINAGRMGMGMSGQAAQARIQEQEAARRALAEMLLQQRQQDMSGALGSRQNAIGAYGGVTPEKSGLDKAAPILNAAAGVTAAAAGKR